MSAPHPTPSPLLIAARAVALGAVVMLTGCIAHATSGGLLPSSLWLGYMALTMTMVGALALREELAPWQLVLLTAGGQFVVHVWLTFTAGHVHPAGVPERDGLGMIAEHGPMMLAHVAAAAVVGWWLGQGERALFTLLALVWCRLLVPLLTHAPHVGPIDRPTCVPPVVRRSLLLGTSLSRRGPPAGPSPSCA